MGPICLVGGVLSYKINRTVISLWIRWLQAIFIPTTTTSADWLWVQTNVAFTCWFIWKARCDFVFNQVRINPTKVVLAISNAVGSFLAAIRNNEDIGV